MTASADERVTTTRAALAAALSVGAAVAVSLGVYARVHAPGGQPLFTLGFSGMLQMKAWLASAAASLLVVQLLTAAWLWGRLPRAGPAPHWVAPIHRWSGTVAFVLTLPPAVHCLWALGFGAPAPRVVLHSIAGCLFYGAYAAKMLGLRLPALPAWGLPVLGGTVLGALLLVWLTAALWFFTRAGLPLI